jgi:hypothetical protein
MNTKKKSITTKRKGKERSSMPTLTNTPLAIVKLANRTHDQLY